MFAGGLTDICESEDCKDFNSWGIHISKKTARTDTLNSKAVREFLVSKFSYVVRRNNTFEASLILVQLTCQKGKFSRGLKCRKTSPMALIAPAELLAPQKERLDSPSPPPKSEI